MKNYFLKNKALPTLPTGQAGGRQERGIVVYLALAIMSVLMSVALGLNAILISQSRIVRDVGDSVFAFYAANTGTERMLHWIYVEDTDDYDPNDFDATYTPGCTNNSTDRCEIDNIKHPITNEKAYYYYVIDYDPSCTTFPNHHCVRVIGIYNDTQRAIEIRY